MKTNAIYCGDCQHVLGNTNEFPDECVDLIYVDPPFFSNRIHEVIWGDGYELRAFEDRWKGGIENYISWMEPKIRECHRILKKTGSMYLHCDYHADHRLRVLMDEIFGENRFRTEIVWRRTNAKGLAFSSFPNDHDIIYYYTKGDKYTFNRQYTPHNEHYIETFYKYIEPGTNRRYRLADLTNPNKDRPNLTYEFLGVKRVWRWSKERMQKAYEKGLIVQTKTNGVPALKRYLDEQEGNPVDSIWTDIPPIQSQSSERLGYPTQKPEALLERIINTSSNPTDTVLDPMCGCGTAIAVAHKTGRRWVGIDVSPTACKLMHKRMRGLMFGKVHKGVVEIEIIGLPKTLSQLKSMQPFDFQNWVIQQLQGRPSAKKVGDMGIDGFLFDGSPIQVKQSEHVGRNVIDNFETAMRRVKKKHGIIVALSFGSGSHEEVARAKNKDGLEIELKTLEDLIEQE
jgi:DNA modification methylase